MRFLGRRVYLGAVVVLASALTHGITTRRVAELGERVGAGLSARTLRRWRTWWRETLPASPFWRGARGRLSTAPAADELPKSLLARFGGFARDAVAACLKFLSPITVRPGLARVA